MNKRLIFIPYAFIPSKSTSVNMQDTKSSYDIYCKNYCVALTTLKQENPNCDVALVTNTPPTLKYGKLLSDHQIHIFIVPYDEFVFPDSYPWSLAFYKLCACSYVVRNLPYDSYCYFDADVVANASLDPVWEECEKNIMLYDINHGLNVRDYRGLLDQIQEFTGQTSLHTHYGGEFFAATRENAFLFVEECLSIYQEIIQSGFETTYGDEFILSLAAERLRPHIKNAGAYIFRFWTGQFRLVCTRHIYNPVLVMHFPDEKRGGIVKLFDRFLAKGKIPPKKAIYRLCHVEKPSFKNACKLFIKSIFTCATSARDQS